MPFALKGSQLRTQLKPWRRRAVSEGHIQSSRGSIWIGTASVPPKPLEIRFMNQGPAPEPKINNYSFELDSVQPL